MPENKNNSQERYVVVIGGINVDIEATISQDFLTGEMNWGKTNLWLGGVGRNTALNLRKLNVPVKMLSVLGKDAYGNEAYKEAEAAGVDLAHTIVSEDLSTSSIVQINTPEGKNPTGIKDITPLELITTDLLEEKKEVIDGAAYCIIDASLSKEVLEYLSENHKEVPFLIDPASDGEAEKLKDIAGKFEIVKPNQTEAEILTEITIKDIKDVRKAASILNQKGSEQVFITLDDGGAVYCDGQEVQTVNGPEIEPESSTGAGDAFNAGLIFSLLNGWETNESVQFAVAASILTLQSELPVHPEYSEEKIKNVMKKAGF